MKLQTPISQEMIESLSVGDNVYLSGFLYTARDAAHLRMYESLKQNVSPPFEYEGQIVFYAGPCPAPPGKPIGSVGPTTAGRMDEYAPALINAGLKVMIGKGDRSSQVVESIIQKKGLYLIAIGGIAALYAKCIISSNIVAYDDLGTEAIRRLEVVNMPLIVAIDSKGKNIFK